MVLRAALQDKTLVADVPSVEHPIYLGGAHTVTARFLADRVESVVGGIVT
jgi:ribosomal protein L31